jgi:diadenosine tetraphosphatase ApaH/serine/threonine PP2A family protein phosphatase
MGTLIVGDVHGCAEELAALVRSVQPERLVLVGDLYTKGPDPAGVRALVRDHGASAVLGNHDARLQDALVGRRKRDEAAARCIATLDAADRAWRAHLDTLPLFLEVAGVTVVHAGLHPSGSLERTTREAAISMRRWPGTGPSDPPWTSVYEGGRVVVYGHDAKRGLTRVERGGRPLLVGLDSGCVYGGALTGWVPEEDRYVQVPARRVWEAVG